MALLLILFYRFFTIDMLPRVHRIYIDLLMPMIGRGINNRIHIRAVQYLPVVSRRLNMITKEFFRPEAPSRIESACRDQLKAAHLQGRLGISDPRPSSSHHRHTDASVGG